MIYRKCYKLAVLIMQFTIKKTLTERWFEKVSLNFRITLFMIVPLVIARNKISNSRIMPQKAVINVLYNSQQADIAGCICQGQHTERKSFI